MNTPAIEELPEFVCEIDARKLTPGQRHFNGSICRHNGQVFFAYRVEDWQGISRIGLCVLDKEWHSSQDRILKFPGLEPGSNLEDPRLTVAQGKLHLMVTVWCEPMSPRPRLFPLGDDGQPIKEIPLPFGAPPDLAEKNWTPFALPDGQVMVQYSLAPQKVFKVNPNKSVEEYATPGLAMWPFGTVSGRCPPLLLPDGKHYLAIFGGAKPWPAPGRERTYYLAAALFSAQAPFAIEAVTPPLIWSSIRNRVSVAVRAPMAHSLCIFPAGVILEDRTVFVSAGINDTYNVILRFSLDDLLNKMRTPAKPSVTQPVAAPGSQTRPMISLRNVALCYKYQKSIFARHKTKIWALHDVSFNLYEGEKLGIIGRNGCGKSTLMKILAKIFEPDGGEVIHSRPLHVQLLSLGVGFEGSLSGRENAVLNGMLLGKSRRHMLSRLEKIKDFSELGEFFDMPVSTYSSGMGVRLGFSVAMETEPEVLLIDEVLGVGDARFAAKSQQAMQEKFNSGQTVVLVTHDAATIRKMCTRAVWIEKGRTVMEGDVDTVAAAYLEAINAEDTNAVHELRPD